jgi:hypothetical protein
MANPSGKQDLEEPYICKLTDILTGHYGHFANLFKEFLFGVAAFLRFG